MIARRPELVERALMLDPALVVPPDHADMLAQQELASDPSFATVAEAVELTFTGLLRRPDEVLEEEVRDHLMRGADGRFRWRYSREAVAAAYIEVAAPPPAWEQAGIPTLMVAAAESKFVSVGEAHRYRFSLGELFRLVVVPGGHSLLWDAFEETADAIEEFVA